MAVLTTNATGRFGWSESGRRSRCKSSCAVSPLAGGCDTSGSTGRPKGVLDSHRNLLHETLRLTRSLRLTANDRQTLVRANCAGAISDTCTALLNGAALLPYDPLTAGIGGVARWMARQRPTIWRSTPSLFRAVLGALPAGETVTSPRVIFLCGEPATGAPRVVSRSLRPGLPVGELFRYHRVCHGNARVLRSPHTASAWNPAGRLRG